MVTSTGASSPSPGCDASMRQEQGRVQASAWRPREPPYMAEKGGPS